MAEPDIAPPQFNYPKTPDEWWEQARYVRAVMPEWGPPDDGETNGQTLSRAASTLASFKTFKRLLEEHPDLTFYGMLDKFISDRDKRAWLVFQTIWEDAPDEPYIHQWTGWGRLCDLCSEGMGMIV